MTITIDSARNTDLVELDVDRVYPSPLNPRKVFDEAALDELAASIREHGLLQPIVVRPMSMVRQVELTTDIIEGGEAYEIIAGERRYRATQRAELPTILARVLHDVDDAKHVELALLENLQRQDLDPIEEAEGYAALNRVAGMRQAAIAAAVNRSQPAIANAMRLLELPEDVRELLRTRQLSVSHGVALCRFREFPAMVQTIANLAVERGTPAKGLEKGMPFEWDLSRAGSIRRLTSWNLSELPFEACAECPFNARRKDGDTQYCLKPEHYDELAAAAEAAQRAKIDAAVATLKAGGQEPLQLADLPHTSYARVADYSKASACTEDCPCRALGCDGGGRVVAICTDPKRYTRLKGNDKREETKARKASVADQLEAALVALDDLREITSREIAYLLPDLVGRFTKANHTAAAKRVDEGPTISQTRWDFGAAHLDAAATHDPLSLVKFLIEASIREDLAQVVQGYRAGADRVTWWLGETPFEASSTESSPGDMLTCDMCSDEMPAADAVTYIDDGRPWTSCVECYESEALGRYEEHGEVWDPAGIDVLGALTEMAMGGDLEDQVDALLGTVAAGD